MRSMIFAFQLGLGALALIVADSFVTQQVLAGEPVVVDQSQGLRLPSIAERFAAKSAEQSPTGNEVPSFQKHISPLFGRLGCNGRACHGSFQGRGDFRLSLFGFDFQADYDALLKEQRVDKQKPLDSLILTKPVDADMHEGGKRFETGGWEYWALRRWVEAGALFDKANIEKITRLEVIPNEISFRTAGDKRRLQVFAHWEDGVVEDVTCLCRYQTNNPAVATIDERGEVTAGDVGDSHVVVSYDQAVVPIEVLRPYSNLTGSSYPQITSKNQIDSFVNAKLKKAGIIPSTLCTDDEFLRRVSLDATGTLPTVAEVKAFVADPSSDKRPRKVDELLERPGYAAQWTTFLCDMTGNNDEQLNNFLPVKKGDLPSVQWYAWIRERLEKNMPYDQLVEGIVTAKSRLPGESYTQYCEAMSNICQDTTGEKFADRPGLVHYWVRKNFRTAEEKAIGFAYSFLGVRIQCAQCHKHPFDQWTKDDFDNFERLFTGIQAAQNTVGPDGKRQFNEMIDKLGVDKGLKANQLRNELALKLDAGQTVPFPELLVSSRSGRDKSKDMDKTQPKGKRKGIQSEVPQAKLLGSDWIGMDQDDIRGKLMDWMRSPANPYFARAFVNRVWAQYFSIGIVNPSDDLSLANAPSNAALLDYLAKGFIDNKFDMKWLHREILNSETYQRSWIENDTNRLDSRNFSHSLLRRLPAEAAYDAVWMALADDVSAEQIVKIGRSRALTTAGSSPQVRRDDTNYALSVFGRNVRESNCDCDRSNDPSLLQTVFLLNDSSVQSWLSDPKRGWAASIANQYGWNDKPMASDERLTSGEIDERMTKAKAGYEKQKAKIAQRMKDATENGESTMIDDLKSRQSALESQLAKMTRRFDQETSRKDRMNVNRNSANAEAAKSDVGNANSAKLADAAMSTEQARTITEQAYLRALCRAPKAEELDIAERFLRSETNRTAAVESLIWSVVNTKEFILNH